MYIAAAVFAVIGVLLLIAAAFVHKSAEALLEDGTRAQGAIVEIRVETRTRRNARNDGASALRDDFNGESIYVVDMLVVRFETPSGEVYDVVTGPEAPGMWTVGDTLEIAYDPANPQAGRSVRDASRGGQYILAIIGVAALIPGLVLLVVHLMGSGGGTGGGDRDGMGIETSIDARVVGIEPLEGFEDEDAPICRVLARWKDPATGTTHEFETLCELRRSDASKKYSGSTVRVRIDPAEPERYEFTLSD